MVVLIPPTYDFSQSKTAVTFTIPFWPGGNGWPHLYGSRFGDALFGSSGSDSIGGWLGDDFIDGRGGMDILVGGAGRDEVHGGTGSDLIYGGADGDWLFGGADGDGINGDAGDDFLSGGSGSDFLYGGDGVDDLNGDDDGDLLDGGLGDDKLRGGRGHDALYGGDGSDDIQGDEGDDYLEGGAGDDALQGGLGADSFVGGAGEDVLRGDDSPPALAPWTGVNFNDVARYIDSASGVEITLTTTSYWSVYWEPSIANYAWSLIVEGWGTGEGGDAEGDSLYSIENIDGSQHGDILSGNDFANVFLGLDGNDELDGGNGDDTLLGGNGDDEIFGGDGNDVIDGGGILSRQVVVPSGQYWPAPPVQSVVPTVEDETDYDESQWWLTNGDDYLAGGAGSDIIRGGGGEDTLIGGDGLNEMYGGDGEDLFMAGRDAEIIDGDVRYENFAPGVLKGDPTMRTYSSFMSDAINDDTVSYQASEQGVTIVFNLTFVCHNFDVILGNGFIQSIIPAYGVQTAVGVGGHADGDQLYSIEHVIGSDFGDHIVGTFLFGNRFEGLGGDDYLSGMGGGDTLVGGAGYDVLVGSGGVDSFIYEHVSDARSSVPYGGGRLMPVRIEEIQSFMGGQDKIDVSAIDADETTPAFNDPFVVVSAFSKTAGELLVNAVRRTSSGDFVYAVAGDTNGDGLADLLMSVEMTGGSKLATGDFVL